MQVLGTLYGSWLKHVLDEALHHRNTKTEDEEKGEFILLEDKFFKELQETNFLSSILYLYLNPFRKTWQRCVFTSEEDLWPKDVEA